MHSRDCASYSPVLYTNSLAILIVYSTLTRTPLAHSVRDYLGGGSTIRREKILVVNGIPAVREGKRGFEVLVRGVLGTDGLDVNLKVPNLSK